MLESLRPTLRRRTALASLALVLAVVACGLGLLASPASTATPDVQGSARAEVESAAPTSRQAAPGERPVGPSAGAAGAPDERPNIVFILADDQAKNSFRPDLMPNTFREIVRPGINMRQAIATPPLCCPYRAGFITGQYPHNHNVTTNRPGYSLLRDKGNVLPAWLKRSGYRTSLVGKYLNKTRQAIGPGPAPGWDDWFSIDLGAGYFDPDVDVDGRVQEVDGYVTDILNDRASEYVASQADARKPFFLWLAEYAPHGDPSRGRSQNTCPRSYAQPEPGALRNYDGPAFSEVRSRSYNEQNIGDKPPKIRKRDRFTPAQKRAIDLRWRCTASAIESMDEGIGEVMDTLRETGQLDDTIVIYSSDNGYFFGEHRDAKGKAAIYEEALTVPLAIRIPPGLKGSEPPARASREIVTQLDLTAGILDWTGARPCRSGCRTLDGLPVTRLLERGAWSRKRSVLYELFEGCGAGEVGVRTDRYAYVGDARGCKQDETELYDLRRDPSELRNLAGERSAQGTLRRLRSLTDRLARCRGAQGERGRPACR